MEQNLDEIEVLLNVHKERSIIISNLTKEEVNEVLSILYEAYEIGFNNGTRTNINL